MKKNIKENEESAGFQETHHLVLRLKDNLPNLLSDG